MCLYVCVSRVCSGLSASEASQQRLVRFLWPSCVQRLVRFWCLSSTPCVHLLVSFSGFAAFVSFLRQRLAPLLSALSVSGLSASAASPLFNSHSLVAALCSIAASRHGHARKLAPSRCQGTPRGSPFGFGSPRQHSRGTQKRLHLAEGGCARSCQYCQDVRHRLRKGQVEVRVRVDKGRQHAAVGGVHPLGARARIPD